MEEKNSTSIHTLTAGLLEPDSSNRIMWRPFPHKTHGSLRKTDTKPKNCLTAGNKWVGKTTKE